MSLNAQFIYDTPQREIASILAGCYQQCTSASLIAGFMTVEGINAVLPPIAANPTKLASLVVGAGTWRAFDAFDRLLGLGVPPDRLRVHLGHTRKTGANAAYGFYRYHPMLHSKVYLFELPDGNATVFVGSHNLTGFALCGLNGEAGVLLSGPSASTEFAEVRAHLGMAVSEAIQYDPALRDAYAWWATQFMEGLAAKFNDQPRDGEAKNTIIILAENKDGQTPAKDDVIYFELPKAIGKVQSLKAEVHVYVFSALPASPSQALDQRAQAVSCWCRAIGVEDDRGGKELLASWYIDAVGKPVLRRAPSPFRPTPPRDMQQVRVLAYHKVQGDFDYLFETGRRAYEPILDEGAKVELSPEFAEQFQALKMVPPEHLPWSRVVGLRHQEEPDDDPYKVALRKLTPGEGAFILISKRRRSREQIVAE
jgi:hypothetical protein